MKLKYIVATTFLLCACSHYSAVKKTIPVPKIGFKIEITNPNQMVVIDSFATILSNRLSLVSNEYKRFEPTTDSLKMDYILSIKVLNTKIIDAKTVALLEHKKKKIQQKYNKLNDSIEQNYSPINGENIAASVAATVVAKAITSQLGLISIIVVVDAGPHYASYNSEDEKEINATRSQAQFFCDITLSDKYGKSVFHQYHEATLTLNGITSESDQKNVLIRNTILFIEDSVPWIKLKK